jgi:hypothetical protein
MHWHEPPVSGKPPGPCNMHTADYVEHRRQIFVFRGGDGREYLNDLHGLDIDTFRYCPPPIIGNSLCMRHRVTWRASRPSTSMISTALISMPLGTFLPTVSVCGTGSLGVPQERPPTRVSFALAVRCRVVRQAGSAPSERRRDGVGPLSVSRALIMIGRRQYRQ